MIQSQKITVDRLLKLKGKDHKLYRKIAAVTAYDYPFARLADKAGIDILLVGDSGGMVTLGYDSTIPVKMSEMLTMSKAVSRGAQRPLLVGDLPFMSFTSKQDALSNSGMFLKDGGMDAVKLEGGREYADIIRALTKAGIPVMGHVGVQPQRAKLLHGFRTEGKDLRSARIVIEDALELESAGAFAIVLEMVTSEVAKIITEKLSIPTIGIGSGSYCDGQILVMHDVLGLYDRLTPRFAKRYINLSPLISSALSGFRDEVIGGKYPEPHHSVNMDPSELAKLLRLSSSEKGTTPVNET